MAAAALAYKCMEVAYMRVVYYKNSSTNRDRHDLQASLQLVPQGMNEAQNINKYSKHLCSCLLSKEQPMSTTRHGLEAD